MEGRRVPQEIQDQQQHPETITKSIQEVISWYLALMVFIVIITTAVGSLVIPLFVPLQEHYQQDLVGLIEAAFVALSTISMVTWGILIDRVENRKRLFLTFISSWIIPCWILGGLQPQSFWMYVALRLLTALGTGGIYPLVTSYMGDVIPPSHRGTLSSLNAIAVLIGTGLGILIGGLVGGSSLFLPFLVVALLGTMGLIMASFAFPDLPRGFAEEEVQKALREGTTYHFTLNFEDVKLLFQQRSNIFLLFQGWLALIPSGMLTYYLVAFFSDGKHGGLGYPLAIATILGLGFASGRFFGYAFFGYLGDKVKHHHENGPVYVASLSTFIQAPLLVISFYFFTPSPHSNVSIINQDGILESLSLLFKPDLFVFGILLFLTTFCGAGSAPNRQALMYDVNVPETRAVMSGLYSLMDQVGLSLGIILGSLFITRWGYGTAFSIATVGWILSAFTWLLATFTYPRDYHSMHDLLARRLQG